MDEDRALDPLSEIQSKALALLCVYLDEHGYPPTMRELGRALGVRSTGHVTYLLGVLAKKGYIQRGHGAARAIRILHRPYVEAA